MSAGTGGAVGAGRGSATAARATGGVGPWHRGLAAILRTAYFGRVPVTGAADPPRTRPRLYVSSHRNGAIDGFQAVRAAPDGQFLVSIQLLRNPVLRLLFTGIPVVRPRDVERYGLRREDVADPVEAARRHLAAGGDVVVFPEGTSEWGHAPGPYKRGAARIVRALAETDVEVDVVPLGLHYSAPDRLASRAEVRRGPVVALPSRAGTDGDAWERAVHERIGEALDAVSVNCPDAASFERVHAAAAAAARRGAPFAETFLRLQAEERAGRPVAAPTRDAPRWPRVVGIALLAAVWPILLAGHLVGRRADGRNTVTFFRMLGGLAGAVLWLPVLAALAVVQPVPVACALAAAVVGRAILAVRPWRP